MLRTLIATAALSALAIASVAVAQEPTPTSPAPPALPTGGSDITTVGPGILPCVGMPQTHGFTEDPGLAIDDFRAFVRTVPADHQDEVDEVTLSWVPPRPETGILCLALWELQPDGTPYIFTTEAYPFLGTHHTLVPRILNGEPRTACWRLQAIAAGSVGPPAEVCAEIEHAASLPPIVDGPFPTPGGPELAPTMEIPTPLAPVAGTGERTAGDRGLRELVWVAGAAGLLAAGALGLAVVALRPRR